MDLDTIQFGIFRNIDSLCLLLKGGLIKTFFVHTDVVTFSFQFNKQKVSKLFCVQIIFDDMLYLAFVTSSCVIWWFHGLLETQANV